MDHAIRTFDGVSYPDAAASDPVTLGYMDGAPPPRSRLIRFSDDTFLRFPQLRWSLSHLREFVPTVTVSRGIGPPSDLGRVNAALATDIDAMTFLDLNGVVRTWAESLHETYTDGMIVLHRGRCVYEWYGGALRADLTHACFSITKSYAATIAELLIHEGALNAEQVVEFYLPQMGSSAFAGATVRQVLDMQVGVMFNEDYADPAAGVWQYTRAAGLRPFPLGYTGPRSLYDYLPTLPAQGAHGVAFAYATVCTEVLCWILRRVSGKTFAALLADRIWSRLGCDHSADLMVDSAGTEVGGAGLAATLRDVARFGELLRCQGDWRGREVIPAAVIENMTRHTDRSKFPQAEYPLLAGYAYRSMWWVANDAFGTFEGRGIFGQRLYVAPKAEIVIARFASHPVGSSAANDPITLPAFRALATQLMGH